jgi:hypothetical protein
MMCHKRVIYNCTVLTGKLLQTSCGNSGGITAGRLFRHTALGTVQQICRVSIVLGRAGQQEDMRPLKITFLSPFSMPACNWVYKYWSRLILHDKLLSRKQRSKLFANTGEQYLQGTAVDFCFASERTATQQ